MEATVDRLELEGLPEGEISTFWLKIAEDVMGLPVRLPIMVARGTRPGPIAGISAAIHGDEINGIPVIHRFFRRLDPTRLRGTVVGVPVVNAQAFGLHQRLMREGFDLNHGFPGDPAGNAVKQYAHSISERILAKVDLLLDLHTASRGRSNTLYVRADLSQSETARMAYLQRPTIILHNPSSDGTLRGAASDMGVPAITVEIGNPSRFQKDFIHRTEVGIRAVLAEWGMLPKRAVREGDPPVVCESSLWLYADAGGLLEIIPPLGTRVVAGEPIAKLTDLFGQEVKMFHAPRDGIVVGRSVDPVAASGARILHLGVEAPADSPLRAHS